MTLEEYRHLAMNAIMAKKAVIERNAARYSGNTNDMVQRDLDYIKVDVIDLKYNFSVREISIGKIIEDEERYIPLILMVEKNDKKNASIMAEPEEWHIRERPFLLKPAEAEQSLFNDMRGMSNIDRAIRIVVENFTKFLHGSFNADCFLNMALWLDHGKCQTVKFIFSKGQPEYTPVDPLLETKYWLSNGKRPNRCQEHYGIMSWVG